MRSVLTFGFVLATLTVAFSQQTPRPPIIGITREPVADDIQGFVKDQAGRPIAGAAVVAKNMSTGAEYRANARDDGWYKFTKLTTADSYEVSVVLPQFENFDAKGVNVGWKLATRLDIVLKPK
jgi:hypothetical protein